MHYTLLYTTEGGLFGRWFGGRGGAPTESRPEGSTPSERDAGSGSGSGAGAGEGGGDALKRRPYLGMSVMSLSPGTRVPLQRRLPFMPNVDAGCCVVQVLVLALVHRLYILSVLVIHPTLLMQSCRDIASHIDNHNDS